MKTSKAIAVSVVLLMAACGESTLSVSPTNDEITKGSPFVQIVRGLGSSSTRQGLGDADGFVPSPTGESFYLAINKAELGKKWFLSAFLTQWHPAEHIGVRSLGSRVVSFKVQNGKLFVFDVADGKAWSDTLDPSLVIESYPVITNNAGFNAVSGAGNYVLFDPAEGRNRFSFVSDDFARSEQVRFQVDLNYLQRFRVLSDGVSYEQVFTGYSEQVVGASASIDQPFRGSGTLAMSLRRYSESSGFVARELPAGERRYFGTDAWQYVKNEPRIKFQALKWNITPTMQPIQWRISKELAAVQADPSMAGVDLAGAIQRGVEGWNSVFGFKALEVVPADPNDYPGDDDKNFIVIDRNPGAGLAFADMRQNPNTGEIRGASVYFSSAFLEQALQRASQAGLDAGSGTGMVLGAAPSLVTVAPRALSWDSMAGDSVCALKLKRVDTALLPPGMTRAGLVEAVVTEAILHEIGHTLGLRHNFKGSLANVSVMDYLDTDDAARSQVPGAYDVSALRYLYGLDPAAPEQAFCSDEETTTDAMCSRFDFGADPLAAGTGPAYTAAVRGLMSGTHSLQYETLFGVTRFVRAPTTEAQRLQAFNLLIADVEPPLRPEIAALSAQAPAMADLIATSVLRNLFLDTASSRDPIGVNPSLYDLTFRTRVAAVAKAILVDSTRDFSSRRTMVDVLKVMQTYEGLMALTEARAAIVLERAGYNSLGQAVVDDLLRRIDVACSPYLR
jgi:hypothetical protein